MFMCRQTGNLLFLLIEKGREKKGWGNTLRQKGDFLGCFYSKSQCSPAFFFKKVWLFQIKAVPLRHENPPSLFTMLKSAGRFVLLWHVIQRHTHHQLSWWHCFNLVDSILRMSHVRRTISATSAITDLVLIFILFWQHRRRIMFSNQEPLSIMPWTCIASIGIFACWCSTRLRRLR